MTSLGLINVEADWNYWLGQWAYFQNNSDSTEVQESPTPEQRELIFQALQTEIAARGCEYHLGQYTEAGVWKGYGRAVTAAILCDSTLALLIAWCRWLGENYSSQ
jgi:hypothetical protein